MFFRFSIMLVFLLSLKFSAPQSVKNAPSMDVHSQFYDVVDHLDTLLRKYDGPNIMHLSSIGIEVPNEYLQFLTTSKSPAGKLKAAVYNRTVLPSVSPTTEKSSSQEKESNTFIWDP